MRAALTISRDVWKKYFIIIIICARVYYYRACVSSVCTDRSSPSTESTIGINWFDPRDYVPREYAQFLKGFSPMQYNMLYTYKITTNNKPLYNIIYTRIYTDPTGFRAIFFFYRPFSSVNSRRSVKYIILYVGTYNKPIPYFQLVNKRVLQMNGPRINRTADTRTTTVAARVTFYDVRRRRRRLVYDTIDAPDWSE